MQKELIKLISFICIIILVTSLVFSCRKSDNENNSNDTIAACDTNIVTKYQGWFVNDYKSFDTLGHLHESIDSLFETVTLTRFGAIGQIGETVKINYEVPGNGSTYSDSTTLNFKSSNADSLYYEIITCLHGGSGLTKYIKQCNIHFDWFCYDYSYYNSYDFRGDEQ